ncbi:MAG: RagB/SusD family nutrient uptake outer membrane protein [Bacteroidales bacterium]|nr:RagB/SusD family nutrient uptake outer membrane protein [Bacteroidales bacterium]
MKRILYIISAAILALNLTACDAIFDNLEGDLNKMTGEDLTSTEDGIDRLFSYLYGKLPMGAFESSDKATSIAVDNHGGKNYYPNALGFWNYQYVRDVNNLIVSLDKAKESGVVTAEKHSEYIAECHFIRAYYYFAMVRTLGGVPIVTEPLDDKYKGDGDFSGLYVKRSTEKESWDFVLSELDLAIAGLPEANSRGTYRANKYSALGLKSRVALYAASVSKYWKQAEIESTYTAVKEKLTYMDASYAADYYKQCIEASEAIINSGKFELYGANPSSVDAAVQNLTDLFLEKKDSEFIFGKSYMTGVSTNSNGFDVPNSPNQAHGSNSGYWSFGNYAVTLEYADMCDYYDDSFGGVDGTIKTRVDGNEKAYVPNISSASGKNIIKGNNYIAYENVSDPFVKKDARFQAWVIYPGQTFRNTEIVIQGGLWHSNGDLSIYELSDNETFGGTTYYGLGAQTAAGCSGFYARGNTNDGSHYCTGFGIRKFLDPTSLPAYSQNPWYDIRYAEILLNYCEAEVELNGTSAGKSKEYLNAIRRRAYFLDSRDATLENVLHERTVELAFEDDLTYTMCRRRSYYNEGRDGSANGDLLGRRHALVPVRDLHTGTPQFVFVRGYFYKEDTDQAASGQTVKSMAYYGSISNYTVNDLIPNPSQE